LDGTIISEHKTHNKLKLLEKRKTLLIYKKSKYEGVES